MTGTVGVDLRVLSLQYWYTITYFNDTYPHTKITLTLAQVPVVKSMQLLIKQQILHAFIYPEILAHKNPKIAHLDALKS